MPELPEVEAAARVLRAAAVGRTIIAVAIEVHCHKRDSASGEFVAFRQERCFGRLLFWFEVLPLVLRCAFHRLILFRRNIKENLDVLRADEDFC